MTRAVAALVAVVLAVWACTVDTRTDKLACTTTDQCSNGRTCQAGYCVVGGVSDAGADTGRQLDAPVCPSACASCDFPTGTCNLTGAGSSTTCPAGWACHITCTDTAPCGAVTCGDRACTVTCSGSGACAAISCASSCQCDVTCNPMFGACGTMTCPMKPGNKYCTTMGIPGAACDSSPYAQCRSCP